MALALRIEFYTRNTLQAEFILEPQWWKADELLATYPFVPRSMNGYMDNYLPITKQHLEEIHGYQLKYLDQAHLQVMENIVLGQLEYVIKSATEFNKIQINIYEWETGDELN